MFGQHQPQHDDNQIPDQSIDAALGTDTDDRPSGSPTPSSWQHPGEPISDVAPVSNTGATLTPTDGQSDPSAGPAQDGSNDSGNAPAGDIVQPSDDATDQAPAAAPAPTGISPNDLLDIKQQALTQLSPLVGHLDQSPEEKFRTTMMMIQASDDQNLVQTAFEAAQAIQDEKARAQALLDVINEINYFTQPNTNNS